MAEDIVVRIKSMLDNSGIESGVQQIQQAFSKVRVGDKLSKQMKDVFSGLDSEVTNFKALLDKGLNDKSAGKGLIKSAQEIQKYLAQIGSLGDKVGAKLGKDLDFSKLANVDPKISQQIKNIDKEIKNLQIDVEKVSVGNLKEFSESLNKLVNKPTQSKSQILEAFNEGDFKKAGQLIDELIVKQTDWQSKFDKDQVNVNVNNNIMALTNMKRIIEEATAAAEPFQQKINELKTDEVKEQAIAWEQAQTAMQGAKSITEQLIPSSKNLTNATAELVAEQDRYNREIDMMKSRIEYFFGMQNTINLVRRALQGAFNSIKELDAAMTETAVVTDFSVGDMWETMPEYTKKANELGVAIKDVYEATTLYYQQGLKTNQAMGLTTQTMKMAKIAGLEAADATDAMTSALRGFNMELNETSGERVADVYSALAATSASNVEELSTAMSKVAALAHNANMEFETTAAFLAQGIETTRESAETIGTALKTVIARFSEVKTLYSEGELTGTDEEGEEIDVNKVSTALRSAGINLNEFLTGSKGLDDIFLELSSKWDTLDTVTQRYIATMAAGSRQQSRFIAMMSDYSRTTELMTNANNSAGASQAQYEKTLESLESKLAQLSNAWTEYITGVANSSVIKGVVDILTKFLNAINAITRGFGPANSGVKSITASIMKLGVAFGTFKVGEKLLRSFVVNLKATHKPLSSLGKSITSLGKSGLGSIKKLFSKETWKGGPIKEVKTAMDAASASQNRFIDVSGRCNKILQDNTKSASFQAAESVKLDQVTKENTIAQADYATALGLSKTETDIYNAALASGLGVEEASKLALSGISKEKAEELLMTAASTDSENALTAARAKEELAIYSEKGAEELKQKTEGKGIITKLQVLGLMAMEKLGILGLLPVKGADASANTAMALTGWAAAAPIIVLIALIASLVLAIMGIVAAVKAIQANSIEGRLQKTKEMMAAASEEVSEATERFNDLTDSQEGLNDLNDELKELTVGTDEWKQKLVEINNQVLELINTYPQLRKYLGTGEFGELTISDEGWGEVINQQQKAISNAQAGVQYWTTKNDQATLDNLEYEMADSLAINMGSFDSQKTTDSYGSWWEGYKTYNKDLYDDITASLKENAAEMANIDSTVIQTLADEYNTTTDKIYEAVNAVRTYNDAIDEQAITERASAKAVINSYLDEESAASKYANDITGMFADSLTGDQYAKKVKETRDQLYKGMDFRDNELFKQVAKKYGVERELTGGDTHDLNVVYAAVKGIDVDDINDDLTRGNKVDTIAAALESEETSKIVDSAIKVMEGQQEAIDTMEKAGKEVPGYIKHTMYQLDAVGKSAENLTGTEIAKITGSGGEDFLKESLKVAATAAGYSVEDYLSNMGYDNEDDYIEARIAEVQEIETARGNITNEALGGYAGNEEYSDLQNQFNSAIEGMTYSAADKFGNMFNNILQVDGKAGAEQFLNSYNELFENSNLGQFQKQQVETLISSFDFESRDISELGEELKELGFDIPDNEIDSFILQMGELGALTKKVDLEAVSEQIKNLNKIAYDIKNGDQDFNFDEDTMNSLISSGVANRSEFSLDASGTYVYIGKPMEELRQAILANTDALLGEGIDQIQGEQILGKAIASTDNVSKYDITDLQQQDEETQREYLKAYIRNATQMAQKEYGWDEATAAKYIGISEESVDALSPEAVSAKITEFYGAYENELNGVYDDKINEANRDILEQQASTQTTFKNASEINTILDAKEFDKNSFDIYTGALISQAQQAGVSIEKINEYREAVKKAGEGDEEAKKQVEELSKELAKTTNTKKAQQAYDDLRGTIQGVEDTLTSGVKDSNYDKAISDIASKATDAFGTTVGEEFVEENKDLFLQMLQGGDAAEEAYEELAKKIYLSDDAIQQIQNDLGLTKEEAEQIAQAKYELHMSGTADLTPIMRSLYVAGTTADAFAEKLSNLLGVQINFEAEGFDFKDDVDPRAVSGLKEQGYVVIGQNENKVVMIKMGTIGTGNGGYVPKDFGSGLGSYGGSGSSGSGKDDKYDPDYDKYYNLVQDLNQELRKRNKLEREYNQLLEDQEYTAQDLESIDKRQLDQLAHEKELQEQLLEGRKKELSDTLSEYSDLSAYAKFNYSDNTIEINWDAINAVENTEKGERIDDYISELERIQDDIEECEDNLDEIEDNQREIKKRHEEGYEDMEQMIYDSVVQMRQDEIDALSSLNDTISDAASELLDGIQERLDKIRQDRENEKTEEDLADKEARLAYLRLDTSGANAVEIANLEKELSEAQEDYTDTLIDQKISELEEQNDKAAEQREKQIKLLEDSLSIDQQTGAIWGEVNRLAKEGLDSRGYLKPGSELDNYLKNAAEYFQMSQHQKDDWEKETNALGAEYKRYSKDGQQTRNDFADAAHELGIDKNTDISKEIDEALKSGDIRRAAQLEKARNLKIEGYDLPYEKTNDYQSVNPDSKNTDYAQFMKDIDRTKYPAAYYAAWKARVAKVGYDPSKAYLEWVDYQALINQAVKEKEAGKDLGDKNFGGFAEYLRNIKLKGKGATHNYYDKGQKFHGKGLTMYKTGGLATTTGPAWLDGTLSKPELVLNAEDTRNFLALTDVLRAANRSVDTSNSGGGDSYYDIDINVDKIDSDYDVDQMAEEVKRLIQSDARWRNNNVVGNIR